MIQPTINIGNCDRQLMQIRIEYKTFDVFALMYRIKPITDSCAIAEQIRDD